MRLHPLPGATLETQTNGLAGENKAHCVKVMVPDQLLLLVEAMAELSEKQRRLQHLQEVPRDGVTYEECRREAEAIHRTCLQLLQQITELSGGATSVN
jgi:hypothetical protein